MARTNSALLKEISGALGKQIVLKQVKGKTVVSQYPDMSKVKPSTLQKAKRNLFKEAVKYAQEINRDPLQKAHYLKKVKEGQSVYHYALKEYLELNKKK